MQEFISKLGVMAKDKVTGFEGVISSVSFDLYGCVQYWLTPPVKKDGEYAQGNWFDEKRLELSKTRVMECPAFESIPGPEMKSAPRGC